MLKELLNVEKFIHKNFIVIEEKDFNPDESKSLLKKHKHNKVFIEHENKTYTYIFSDKNKTYDVPTQLIQKPDDTFELLSYLNDRYLILIEDKQQLIGYLHVTDFFNDFTYQFNYVNSFANALVDTIDESYTVIDQHKRVVFWTKGAEKIFSIAREEIIDKKINDFFDESNLEILNTLQTGESETNKKHYAGENLIVIINTKPIKMKEDVVGAIVTEKDITNIIHLNNELYEASQRLYNLESEIHQTDLNPFNDILGNSPKIQRTKRLLNDIVSSPSNVTIVGEYGVGKELYAKSIHRLKEPKEAPFIPLNCNTIPDALFDSELFGFEEVLSNKSNASSQKGKAELANGGTLFLNAVNKLSLDAQEKLVTLLENKAFIRIGGIENVHVEFKVIASSKEDLKSLVEKGDFNIELYHRLNGAELEIPPLRERSEDIIELTHYYLHEYSVRYNRPIHGISQQIMNVLLEYDWPNNIRELKSTIERLVVFSDQGFLKSEVLPFYEQYKEKLNIDDHFIVNDNNNDPVPLKQQLEKYEKDIIISELEKVDGNKRECADNLGITRATLYNRIERLKIDV